MNVFLSIEEIRRRDIIEQVAAIKGLPAIAIEKDWWVTLTLNALFTSKYSDSIVFKGGTSLSKAWGLIERFSEDIDLGIDKDIIDDKYKGDLSKETIKKLRASAARFICNEFKAAIEDALIKLGVDTQLFELSAPILQGSYSDPIQLELKYKSIVDYIDEGYLRPRVLIEGSARGGQEPAENRLIQSMISNSYPDANFSDKPFFVNAINPQRTFIEKTLLLHEEFLKPTENVKSERMSRHLYDIERIMDTEYGKSALSNLALFRSIVQHREKYTRLKGISYENHTPGKINFLPPSEIISFWEKDYITMREQMIFGEHISFNELINRLILLKDKFRLLDS